MTSFATHYQCLSELGLEPDYFTRVEGEWTDYFEPEYPLSDSSSGEFGDVVLVRRKSDNRPFALKLFKRNLTSDEYERIGIVLHLSALIGKRKWPRALVRYIGAIEFGGADDEKKQAILMETVAGETIRNVIDQGRVIPSKQWRCYLRDIAGALDFLHDYGIAHRDVHSGNIMITKDGKRAVLLDLDLACRPDGISKCNRLCRGPANIESTPPDLWSTPDYNSKDGIAAARWMAADVWGAASSFLSLHLQKALGFAEKLPYSRKRNTDPYDSAKQMTMCEAHRRTLDDVLQFVPDKELQRVLIGMLALDWEKRLTAKQVIDELKGCSSRSAFRMPLSSLEYKEAVATGKISAPLSYYDI